MKTQTPALLHRDRGPHPLPKSSWRCATIVLVASLLAGVVSAAPAPRSGPGGKRDLAVMTQNCYVGAEIERVLLLDPADPAFLPKLIETVTTIYGQMLMSQPATRMSGVAQRIASQQPEVVALQEVYLLRTQSPGDLAVGGGTPATNVVIDFLNLITNSLAGQGVHYSVAAANTEADVELPMLNLQTGGIDDARLTDREVILVRSDLPPGQLRLLGAQGGHFTNVIVLPSVGITVWRGWCSADLCVRGRTLRFINAHLEEETQPVLQYLQGLELLGGPANTSLPVLVTGDLNSDGNRQNGTLTYDLLLTAGFVDPWAVLHPGMPGLTWGHDALLADPSWPLVWRLDLVLARGSNFSPQSADVLDNMLPRLEPPRWPSDHAGVSVHFRLK